MKLTDFTLIPLSSDSTKFWATGSNNNYIGTGSCKGKKFRIKVHNSPIWYCYQDTIAAYKAEKRKPDADIARLESSIASAEKCKASWEANDRMAEEYLFYKNKMNKELAKPSPYKARLFGAESMWKDKDAKWGNSYKAVEAVRECTVLFSFKADSKSLPSFTALPEKEQFRLLASFAQLYAYLHANGILHSDIKMTNMLITKDSDGKPTAAVIDFDAVFFYNDLPVSNSVYMDNVIGGTLMSPEHNLLYKAVQDGEAEDFDLSLITPKSDVFSFGLAMYECLYGKEAQELPALALCDDKGDPYTSGGKVLTTNEYADYEIVAEGFRYGLPQEVKDAHPYFASLFSWMTCYDPEKRPTMVEVKTALEGFEEYGRSGKTIIPKQYLPIDIHTPWDEEYEFYPSAVPDLISVEKALSKGEGWYLIKRSGYSRQQHASGLQAIGLLRKKGGKAVSGIAASSVASGDVNTPWESDHITFISDGVSTITRVNGKNGMYFVKKQGSSITKTASQLVAEKLAVTGKLSPDEVAAVEKRFYKDKNLPWERDGIKFAAHAPSIERDIFKGEGWYIVEGKSLSKDALIVKKLASFEDKAGVTPSDCWDEDGIRLIPTPGVTVIKGFVVGKYYIKKDFTRTLATKNDLIRLKLAEPK